MQEVFARAVVHWRRVRELDDPAGWVLHVALNRCRSTWRTERRRSWRFRTLAERAAVALTGRDVDLWQAIGRLPGRQRAAVALYYLADLPVQAVADLLHVSPGTIKSQLSDARRSLYRALEERTDEPG